MKLGSDISKASIDDLQTISGHERCYGNFQRSYGRLVGRTGIAEMHEQVEYFGRIPFCSADRFPLLGQAALGSG